MTPEQLFAFTGPTAMLGWLCLLAYPLARRPLMLVGGFILPGVLSVCYVGLILAFWTTAEGGFDSLANVMLLFDTPGTALAGWVHFLAFDLFIGGWIVRDAARAGILHVLTWPCLVLTFLFGPAGLFLHFGLRAVMTVRAPTPSVS